MCNKVLIREYDPINLDFKFYILNYWTDIKLDSGFVREYKKNKYYYDKNNNIINVESVFTYPSFPAFKKGCKARFKSWFHRFRNIWI